MKKSFVTNDISQGTVHKKITYTIMVSSGNGHNFRDACSYSCHRSSSGGGSGIVVVVTVVAVNHCPALHSQPYCPLTDLKLSHIFKIILSRLATIVQVEFLKQ